MRNSIFRHEHFYQLGKTTPTGVKKIIKDIETYPLPNNVSNTKISNGPKIAMIANPSNNITPSASNED